MSVMVLMPLLSLILFLSLRLHVVRRLLPQTESSVCSVCDWVSVDFVNGKLAAEIGSLLSSGPVRSVCVEEVFNCGVHA